MYHLCTLFDQNYLLRGLTLYRSLTKHTQDFIFYALCLDEITYTTLTKLKLQNLKPITLNELEEWDKRLKEAKANRSQVEYYFTLSPALPLYILEHYQEVDIITYLDADLFFYQKPAPIYEELGEQSILIVEHRFSETLKHLEKNGRFNIEYQSFRNDEQGKACLNRWHKQCLTWCYDRHEGDKYADQKYLDEWPDLYDRLVILQHKGAGIAPWNWSQYTMDTNEQNETTIDGYPLIFCHFHGIKILNPCFISHTSYDKKMPRKHLKWYYRGYIKQMKETTQWLKEKGIGQIRLTDKKFIRPKKVSKIRELLRIIKLWRHAIKVC
jgi:hypothetical protein